MAAPTNAVRKLQKILANGEPSTHRLIIEGTNFAETGMGRPGN
jgi:hypothetical protein